VRLSREAPAAATAIVLSGAFVGGTLGPVGFGLLVEYGSYRLAWSGAAGCLVLATCALWIARRGLRADRQRRQDAGAGPATPNSRSDINDKEQRTWDR
jgi:hypothetical protein